MQRVPPVLFAAFALGCGPIVPVLDAGDGDGGSTADGGDGDGDTFASVDDGGDAPPPGDEGEVGEVDGGDADDDDGDGGDTGIPSGCGDGVQDDDEPCDDGNDVPGDGCEADCTPSPGQLLWSQAVDGAGQDDAARAVAAASGAEILVAGSLETAGNDDLWLRVVNSDGIVFDDHIVDLGDDEIGTSIAIAPDGTGFVAGVAQGDDRAILMRRDGGELVELDGAPTDITAFSALASPTAEGFVLVTHAGNFDALAATVRRYDGAGSVLGDVTQPTGQFVGAAIGSPEGGTILGGGSFGGMGTPSTVWLAGLAVDGSPTWNSSMEAERDVSLRIRGLAVDGDGRIVGVGTRGFGGGPNDEDEDGWIWWWSAQGQPEGDGPLDIGGAAARPSSVVVGSHGLIVGGITVATEDGFVAGLSTEGELQWGYQLTGDLGVEDRISALALVPGGGVVAVGRVSQIGSGEDAWIGMFTE